MRSILVVCEGNICRSPMAEGLLAAALPQACVHSAGLLAMVGHRADEIAVRLMRERGIDIAHHRAVQITREMCQQCELVLTMSADQRKHLEYKYPFARGRVFRLAEFDRCDIPDPYMQLEVAFRESLRMIDEGVRQWIERIRKF